MAKTGFITGSTDGIGKAAALQLKKLGWRVLIHGRSEEKLKQTAQELGVDEKDAYLADFTNMDAVKAVADELVKDHQQLNALINNAGVYVQERQLTVDGFETTMAVNHLAHFLLTSHLLKLLKQTPQGRIINVSSLAHISAQLDLHNLDLHEGYSGHVAYANSKLANLLFTRQLAKKLPGSSVTVNALHPGVINTKLLTEGFGFPGKSLKRGAKALVNQVTNPELAQVSGQYFNKMQQATPSETARDDELAANFWQVSTALLEKFLWEQDET